MKIPFADISRQYSLLKEDIYRAVDQVFESRAFIQGAFVEKFSSEFCRVHGGRFGVGVSNGTSSLVAALRALGIGYGDEVITVTNTFFATVEAIDCVGAKIVLVDCCPDTYGIDVSQIESKITKKTKAIIPVHLYGNPADMKIVMQISKKYNIHVIEDCAQAHLASFDGQAIGTFGDIGSFSFFPGKNLGAFGDAGLLITGNEELARRLAQEINHGRIGKYEHEFFGNNFRMDGIQAAILSAKLPCLRDWTNKRQAISKIYNDALIEKGFKTMKVIVGATCSYHLFVVECANRDEVQHKMLDDGIETGIHYPIPCHKQPAFLNKYKNERVDLPHAERISKRILSLPLFPELTAPEIERVLESFTKIAKK